MCCLYMEDSAEQDAGLLVPPGVVVPESSNSYSLDMDQISVEPFLTTDVSSAPMIDLIPNAEAVTTTNTTTTTPSTVGNEFHYLIHGDLPRGMFLDQLDMLNFPPLDSPPPPPPPPPPVVSLSMHHHQPLESLDDIVHASALPPSGSSFTQVSARSSSSAASSSSGGEFTFTGAHDTGATSILHAPPPPPENGNISWSQVQAAPWCDPSIAFYNNNESSKGSLFLDSVVTNSANTTKEKAATNTTTTTGQGMHATMRETLYRMAIWRPVNTSDLLIGGGKPKRRNVKISSDPQTVAARHRRERISTKIRILQRLVPGGTKMDTASMLDEAIHYVKYLKSQVQAMELLEQSSESLLLRGGGGGGGSTATPATSTITATSATTSNTTTTTTTTTAGAGMCHLYNPGHGSIFWPQQFSMDSASGLVVQQVNISGY